VLPYAGQCSLDLQDTKTLTKKRDKMTAIAKRFITLKLFLQKYENNINNQIIIYETVSQVINYQYILRKNI